MKKIKTLLLGLGRIASLLEKDKKRYHPCTHAGVILSSPLNKLFSLEGIYDPNTGKINEFMKDWKINKNHISSDLKTIKNQEWDLVIIASSSDAHFENLELASKLKIPLILCEKPICKTVKDLKKIQKIFQKYKPTIWVNHERRYHPIYQYVQENLLNGNWGEIKTIKASVLTSGNDPGIGFTNLGGGPLLHDGTHAVDFLDFLFGVEPEILYSEAFTKSGNKSESRALAILKYPNNIRVFLEAGGERNYFQFELDIQTSMGRFILSNDGHNFFFTKDSKLYQGFKSLSSIPLPKIPYKKRNPWILLYQEIIELANGVEREIKGSIEANFRILNTIERIYKKAGFKIQG
jgi:predicted dehydrogenase